jgi:DNA-binding transcriptional MerR regulator
MQTNKPASDGLPDKLYFKIGEVGEITGLPTYVLRFWESEFPKINPKRTPSGQRLYRKSDIATILQVKSLLYEKKFTIEGARNHLKAGPRDKKRPPATVTLEEIRSELKHIRKLLS